MWRTWLRISIFNSLVLLISSLATTSESKDSRLNNPKFDVKLVLTSSQSDDFDIPGRSVLYPSSAIIPDGLLLSGETPEEEEEEVVEEAENRPPAISRMPQNFYRRRFIPRRPWGLINGNNYPMGAYSRWGPPPYNPEMMRRGFGTNSGNSYRPGPGSENLYNGNGIPDYNNFNGENGCGGFRCMICEHSQNTNLFIFLFRQSEYPIWNQQRRECMRSNGLWPESRYETPEFPTIYGRGLRTRWNEWSKFRPINYGREQYGEWDMGQQQ